LASLVNLKTPKSGDFKGIENNFKNFLKNFKKGVDNSI